MKKFYILAVAMIFAFSLNAQTVVLEEGFENEAGASLPAGWISFSASDLIATDSTLTDAWADDDTWFVGNVSAFGDPHPEYIHSGDYAAMIGYTAGQTGNAYNFLVTPEITLGTGSSMTYWMWYFNDASSGWLSNVYVTVYDGTEWTTVASYIGAANNEYDSAIELDLSDYDTKTVKIAFGFEYTDGYQSMVDDVTVSTTMEAGISTINSSSLVFPNPTTGLITVNADNATVKVMDITGRTVLETSDKSFDISANAAGVYFVEVNDGFTTEVQKIVLK